MTNSHNLGNTVDERMGICNQFAIVVVTLIILAYCVGMQFIVSDLQDNAFFHLVSIVPAVGLFGLFQFLRFGRLNPSFVFLLMGCLTIEMMCVFTLLSRACAYHVDDFEHGLYNLLWVNETFVLNALLMSVPLFVLVYLVLSNFEIDQVVEHKDAANRMLLDLLDIFSMQLELGLVEEMEPMEMAMQVFMTLSFLAVVCALISPLIGQEKESDASLPAVGVHVLTLAFNNVPFFVLRAFLWERYDTIVLTFMAKNLWFILLSGYGLLQQWGRFRDFHKHIQVYDQYDSYDAYSEPYDEG